MRDTAMGKMSPAWRNMRKHIAFIFCWQTELYIVLCQQFNSYIEYIPTFISQNSALLNRRNNIFLYFCTYYTFRRIYIHTQNTMSVRPYCKHFLHTQYRCSTDTIWICVSTLFDSLL